MISADRDHSRDGHRALVENNPLSGPGPDVRQTDAHFALVISQHRVRGSQRLKYSVVHVDSGSIYRRDHVLRGASRGGNHVYADFKTRRHHAQRIVKSGVVVPNEFLRQQMEDLAVGRQRNRTRSVDRLLDLIAANFPRTRAQADAAMAVDPAYM